MKFISFSSILWRSIAEAGFIAGLVATFVQFLELSGIQIAAVFAVILTVLTITIFNIRLYYTNRTQQPFIEFVNGHDEAFDLLTTYVKSAKENIWVTRFSKGSIIQEHDYFNISARRISGEGCKLILTYRRVMNIDSCDKAEMICTLIEKFGSNKNFFLRKTDLVFFFELLIIDGTHVFIMFHEPGSTGTINGALRVSKPEIVPRFKEIYEAIWNHSKTEIIKEKSVLRDEERNKIISIYSNIASNLPY
jgi:hypothetical protein